MLHHLSLWENGKIESCLKGWLTRVDFGAVSRLRKVEPILLGYPNFTLHGMLDKLYLICTGIQNFRAFLFTAHRASVLGSSKRSLKAQSIEVISLSHMCLLSTALNHTKCSASIGAHQPTVSSINRGIRLQWFAG